MAETKRRMGAGVRGISSEAAGRDPNVGHVHSIKADCNCAIPWINIVEFSPSK